MKLIFSITICIWAATGFAQVNDQLTLNEEFDKEIRSWIDFSVPIISCKELSAIKDDESVILLDARELNEYNTSHIPGAKHIGYNKFKKKDLENLDKDSKVIVYCSIGYRSEKIGEKLKDLGFGQVYNLYGSIFEWANQGNQLENKSGETTQELHTYNRQWSKWVDNQAIEKKW